jgi:hypothetical protein
MVSTLTWLDVSSEQHRRVREIIRLFEEPGTRDELGVGPIRDSFSDQLFPGTSVIQTRARYFLFVPWLFQAAVTRGRRGQALLDQVDRSERQLIERFRTAGITDGLIGRQAGARVKILPSTIYWGGLTRWGVLAAPMTPKAVAEAARTTSGEEDELAVRSISAWQPTLPPVPPGFPSPECGGFSLTAEEAAWLHERIEDRVAGTLLAHLVTADPLGESDAPWTDPASLTAPAPIREVLEEARRFSILVHGAALLYNLLASEHYESKGFTRVDSPVDWYRESLDNWAGQYTEDIGEDWDWPRFWDVVQVGNPRVPPSAKVFVESWHDGIARSNGPENVATDQPLRDLVRGRVAKLRGSRAVLGNDKLLATWGGSSGSSALVYRWGTVRQLVIDIQEGLANAGA